MDVEHLNKRIQQEEGLSRTLGMQFLSTPDPDTCMARMKVNEVNRQVFGFLSGGATLALAENLAGVGSMAVARDRMAVGINVSGNHVRAVMEGDTVTALARLTHKGRTLHTWQVEVTNEAGELVSSVQVTNYILSPHKNNKQEINTED
ncbi:MAG: PaaI family thioesterase [Bacteroidaceae bacterium]|nr:PaaI family thioesterase [Bacteroidaceae bacterium]MDE6159874.1 PaaI family thioesterase [Bacteroidaceae bacterium]